MGIIFNGKTMKEKTFLSLEDKIKLYELKYGIGVSSMTNNQLMEYFNISIGTVYSSVKEVRNHFAKKELKSDKDYVQAALHLGVDSEVYEKGTKFSKIKISKFVDLRKGIKMMDKKTGDIELVTLKDLLNTEDYFVVKNYVTSKNFKKGSSLDKVIRLGYMTQRSMLKESTMYGA